MLKRTLILSALVLASVVAMGAGPQPLTLVICAPGYPGTTSEAQPSMDALAAAVSKASGLDPTTLTAEYHESEEAGVARLKAGNPAVAIVPLPFFLSHAADLKLTPRAQAVEKDGKASVTWTLVAKKGRVTGPASLSGFTIISLASYAPDFIRNVALVKWGKPPSDVTFAPAGQILSSLRKAANGDNVAVLLDETQARSLTTLPFANELETVTTSPSVPGFVVCSVGTGAPSAAVNRLLAGLLKMSDTPAGASALDAVRLAKFVPLDDKGIAAARASYGPPQAKAL